MVEIRLLGQRTLRSLDGTSLQGVLSGSKRLALFAYLVLARPRGFHSRDTLLALFWPESDESSARNALNNMLYHLRRAIGEGAISTRGDGEVGVSTEALWCDVWVFEEALEAGRPEDALELYRGPLLEGFHVSSASSEFSHWLDGERGRLRRMHGEALEHVAERAEKAEDFPRAVDWWRKRAAAEPYSGRVATRLMKALERAGNRAGALQHARVYEQLVEKEFGAPPDPEVLALAERLRTAPARDPGTKAEQSSQASVPEASSAESAPSQETSAQGEPPERLPGAPEPGGPPPEAETLSTSGDRGNGEDRTSSASLTRSPAAWRILVTGAVVILALAGGASLVLDSNVDDGLVEGRIVVLPFENRTSEPSLDPVGRMTADWITQGLSRTGLAQVVPAATALASARHIQQATNRPGQDRVDRPTARLLAEQTGAELVITGAFYRERDSLHFQAQVTDARTGELVGALRPTASLTDDPIEAIELLRQRVLVALAIRVDPELATHAEVVSQPPSYDAYRAYTTGLEHFLGRDYRAAIQHFSRAHAFDSTYTLPLLHAAMAHMNRGEWAAADSLTGLVDRSRLAPYDQVEFDGIRGSLAGDNLAAYEAAREGVRLAPGARWYYQLGRQALRLGRAREAARVLPTEGPTRGWLPYWRVLTQAFHLLGEHEREREAAERAQDLHPDDPNPLLYEARAWAALGRTKETSEEMEQLVQTRLLMPHGKAPDPGRFMALAAGELRAHGHGAAAQELYGRAIDWYRSRPEAERDTERWRRGLADALYGTDHWKEAEALYRTLAGEDPERVDLQGMLGVLAVRQGRTAEAERISDELAALERPYLRGEHTLWRARVAAQLGREDEAVDLLREAMSQGQPNSIHFHTDPDLDPLRNHPGFRELARIKG
jgi:DNA-binding SARP family transcriptional activator/predicted Zn-dependent protease/TolB-like protein